VAICKGRHIFSGLLGFQTVVPTGMRRGPSSMGSQRPLNWAGAPKKGRTSVVELRCSLEDLYKGALAPWPSAQHLPHFSISRPPPMHTHLGCCLVGRVVGSFRGHMLSEVALCLFFFLWVLDLDDFLSILRISYDRKAAVVYFCDVSTARPH